MIKDITIGQYYPQDSMIHKLDPRVKIIGTLVFILSLFLFQKMLLFVYSTIVLGSVIKLSKVPFRFIIRGLKGLVILLLIAASVNLFFTAGIPIFQIGFIQVTKEGIRNAIFFCLRLGSVLIGSQIMTLTSTPLNLADGMENLMGPLKKIGVPVHEISMMILIAIRFIPILLDEADKIMKAQMARGADFETGGLIKKAKNLIPIIVPLIVSAFRRANDLALAMDSRNYVGGEGRTKFKPLQYGLNDKVAYIIMIIYIVMIIVFNKLLF